MSHSTTDFRPDVEGLRGLAVLLVVLFHAGLGVPGGFVGVDVFFVISGYLISGRLLRELDASGRIDFARFYARRVRRLLPAAAIVLVATLAVSWWLIDPLDRADVELDGAAAALFISNIRFAVVTGDYFSAVASPSPLLHFWSLAVEEQFYLLWPAVLLVAARLAGLRTAATVLMAIFVASLAAELVLTQTAVGWAFYSLPTRAFELAAGGLVAAAELVPGPSRLGARLVGLVGCGAIVWSALAMDASLAYPGVYALVPALGAAGILMSRPTDEVGRLLALPPMRWLGRISYSLYLWHWPLFVLAPMALVTTLTLPGRLALSAIAIGVAAVSWRFVEEPFRRGFSPATTRSRRTVLAGLAALVAIAATSSTLAAKSSDQLASLGGGAASAPGAATSLAGVNPIVSLPSGPSVSSNTGAAGTATPAPTSKAKAGPKPTPAGTPRPTPQPVIVALPSNVRPSLAAARNDKEILWSDGCLAYEPATAPPTGCVFGNRSGSFTIALVGDSHASALFPAVDWVARRQGARLLPFVKVACPFIDMRVVDPIIKREYTECASWNAAVLDRLASLHPDLTIVAMSHWIYPLRAVDTTASRIGAAVGRMLSQLRGRVVLLVDTPHASVDVPACLSKHVSDIRPCATPRGVALSAHGVIERIAANAADVPTVDLAPAICPASPCAAVVGGMIVWRDSHHLTATFAAALGPVLNRGLARFF
jgi:peptidoglycan/LPS O-acetylase OafA/YrhL